LGISWSDFQAEAIENCSLDGKIEGCLQNSQIDNDCSPHDHDWQQLRAFLVGKEPQQFLHFEGDVFPEIEGDFLNINGIGKPYAVQCGFS
jgi:hypothetical protein